MTPLSICVHVCQSVVSVVSVDEPRYRVTTKKRGEIEKTILFSYGLPYFNRILAADSL